jgi:4-cresol dehydrogenase (hydroxylating)
VRAARAEAGEQGYGDYRAHLDFMDLAAEQYSFDDHAYRRFTETIKDALDPNGIRCPAGTGSGPSRSARSRRYLVPAEPAGARYVLPYPL